MQKYFHLIVFCLLIPLASKSQEQQPTVTGQHFTSIKESYSEIGAWGMETIIDVKNCDPELIRSSQAITKYVHALCDLIQMKRFGDTVVVHFGQKEEIAGYSMTQLIESSLISGHFANATNSIYINIFSCKPYDPYQAALFTQDFFKGEEHSMNVVLRK